MKSLKIFPILLAATLLPMIGITQKAKAQEVSENYWGNSLDIGWYCRNIGADNAVLVSNDVFGWRCQAGDNIINISIEQVCNLTYGSPYPIGYGMFDNPSSWFCGTPKQSAEFVKNSD